MAVSYTSSGASSSFTLQCADVTDLENTGLNDLTGTTTVIYSLDLDNAANGALTYFKLYDNKTPTYGTDDPSLMIQVAASTRQVWTVAIGLTLSSGISIMACTVDGPEAGSSPGSSFNCALVMT